MQHSSDQNIESPSVKKSYGSMKKGNTDQSDNIWLTIEILGSLFLLIFLIAT